MKEATLLEQGMLAILVRHLPQDKAENAIVTLRKAYPDWNELRVAQVQEISAQLLGKGRKASRSELLATIPAARDVREYLQEVFQKTHGLELEILKEDPAGAGKLVQQMPFTGLAAGSYLMWLAANKDLPVHGALVRVLDRLGLISRTASMKKAREVIDPLVGDIDPLTFVTAFGEIADRWCDARKPLCHVCVLVSECTYGKKAFQEWKTQQVRLEAQRVKDEARQAALMKKEEARRAREEARAAKLAAVEAKKREKERQKKEAQEAKRKAIEAAAAARAAAQKKKAALAEKIAAEKAAKAAKAKEAARKKHELTPQGSKKKGAAAVKRTVPARAKSTRASRTKRSR
jgi:endonuclease III